MIGGMIGHERKIAGTIVFVFSALMLIVGAASADAHVMVNVSVHPHTISLDEVAHVSLNITSTSSERTFPVDVVLVMDCSGSMKRYGTIIAGPHDVVLSESCPRYCDYYEKVGEFTIHEREDVEVMLQVPKDVYYYYDKFQAYLKNKATGTTTGTKEGYSTVRWDDLTPGTYEVYAKLKAYHPSYSTKERIFAVEIPPVRIDAAKDAACAFVDMLGDDDRVAVVKFHSDGWRYEPYCNLVQPLESDKIAVKNVIRNTLEADGGTPMGEGLDRALHHLESNHARDNAMKAIILLTDGWWNMGCNPIEQAYRAKSDGIPIFTIGWGGVNESMLRDIAEISGGEFYMAATGDELRDIYENIATNISNITAKNAILTVELSDKVEYAGNASRTPEINGRDLIWYLGTLHVDRQEIVSFDVRPEMRGRIPINTNKSALRYEIDRSLREASVPVVYVNVKNRPPVIERIGWSVNTTCIYHDDETKQYVFMANESDGLNERGTVIKLTIHASDPDGDTLTFSKDAEIGKLETNDFLWSPGYDFVVHPETRKNVTITFTVSDGALCDNATVYIIVNDVNRPPILDEIGNKSVIKGDTLTINLHANDQDGDILIFSCNRTDLFTDFNIKTGVGHWHTDHDDAGVYYVDFGVSDGRGGADNITVKITVMNVTWEGNHTFELSNTTIGDPVMIKAFAYDIRNELNESVNITAELRVDGMRLNSSTKEMERKTVNGTINVSAVWVPMSSGVHVISLHLHVCDKGSCCEFPEDPRKKVAIHIRKVRAIRACIN